jgi:hypothetical protein
MKNIKNLIRLLGVLFVILSMSSCYYDEILEDAGPIEADISFENDIISIFDASCNIAGCHNSGGIAPDLTPANAFNSLINNGYIDIDNPVNSELYLWVSGQKSTPMPVSGVDPVIRNTILAWIEQGAQNN